VLRKRHEPDAGVYDAMNKAMLSSKGEWLLFLGSDDELIDEHALERMLQGTPASSIGVVYGNVKVVGETSWARDGSLFDGPFDLHKLMQKNICHQAIFYRASLVKQVGLYNQNYRMCADWDFNMRCWSQTQFLYRDVVVAKFHAGGISTNAQPDSAFEADCLANVRRYGLFSRLSLRNRFAFLKGWATVKLKRTFRLANG
jgi:glycosyltransferase involved in cell wall biosynthesis